MFDIANRPHCLPAMAAAEIERVRQFAAEEMLLPQVPLKTKQILNGGVYTRTVCVPAGTTMTGALIKIPTQVIVSGDAVVWIGDEVRRVAVYEVFAAAANRKQVFDAIRETYVTMTFATKARTTEEAEREFSDEHELLASRRGDALNEIIVTGE